jgi:hypothetical protein
MKKYPEQILDTSDDLSALLSSFWREEFKDKHALKNFYDGIIEAIAQLNQNKQELSDLISPESTPVFHLERWYALTIKESEVNTGESSLLRYEPDNAIYDGTYSYGIPTAQENLFVIDIPEDLVGCKTYICDQIRNPSILWFSNIAFTIEKSLSALIFKENPFLYFPIRNIVDASGNIVDREITLWMHNTLWDQKSLYNFWGSVVNIDGVSSEYYKEFLSAYFTMITKGPNIFALSQALSGISGVCCAKEEETVKAIYSSDQIYIITDLYEYSAPLGSDILVAIDQTLTPGQNLFDVWKIVDSWEDISELSGITIPSDYISGISSSLTFPNEEVEVEWHGFDGDGKAIATFRVDGDDADITTFWDTALAEGKIRGFTIAEALDTRQTKSGQPMEHDMPIYVNPAQFIYNYFLKGFLYLIVIKPNLFKTGSLGDSYIDKLKEVIAPHKSFLIVEL